MDASKALVFLALFIAATTIPRSCASDPDLLQDLCVAETSKGNIYVMLILLLVSRFNFGIIFMNKDWIKYLICLFSIMSIDKMSFSSNVSYFLVVFFGIKGKQISYNTLDSIELLIRRANI